MKKPAIGLICIIILVIAGAGIFFLSKKHKFTLYNQKSSNTSSNISALIVPHHDLVKDQRVDFFKSVSLKVNPQTIILVSPNHFNSGSGQIITTDKTWQLSNGELSADKEKINQLVDLKAAVNQEAAFSREHGITNLLPDLKQYFPRAKIIPIILRQNGNKEEIANLATELQTVCSKNCLLVASVDFSHYQPGALAEIHDQLSIQALANLDEDLIMKSEVDSPQSLLAAILWAKDHKTEKFNLDENTNSGKIANERDAESTSYVFGAYQAGVKKEINNELTFMLGGDMMFDRLIDYKFRGEKLPDVMQNLGERFFWGTNISMVNLEGPISSMPIEPDIRTNNLVFNFPPKTADVLKWLHINTVSLANNHTNNAGKTGLENTQKVLGEKNITYIGQQSELNDSSVRRFQSGNQKMSIITINELANNDDLTAVIQQEKKANSFVLIFPHWGNEYEKTHSTTQQNLAHSWIDNGADLVVGSHPHVVQDAEIYQGKVIFYSLGNLLFDQMFSSETQQGLVIAGKIKNNELKKIVILPTIQKNLKPQLLTGSEKTDLITKLRKNLGLEKENKDYGYDIIGLK